MTESNIPDKLLKPYDPAATEDRLYQEWEQKGYFKPENGRNDSGQTFSIVLPPPNVTGQLHMGHAIMLAIEDIMVRFHRMRGDKTLWIPGTDHAAIATQSKVEKEIQKKEGKTRHDLGREELLRRVTEYAAQSRDTIVNQTKKMGSSLDWDREAFTLDEARSRAVREAFKRMYDAGLIYRGNRIVNWDPKGQTTISDDEIVYEERETTLYTFRYSADFPIAIATTRPETKLGDTGVAVHPDDARYQQYIGQEYAVDFAGTELKIKIVADTAVDPAFGTGAVGVTPAHSLTDAEIARRTGLPAVQVINEYAKISIPGPLQGKKVAEAREAVVEWLRANDLLEQEEKIKHNVGAAERTGGIIEPLPKLQWFVDVNKKFPFATDKITGIKKGQEVSLKEVMQQVVSSGQIKILPDRFNAVYFNWVNNLRDWCISRQIWYGHRIPVYYKGEEIYVGVEAPQGEGWAQDEDSLDTWFSSGLWTFSTLGWPDQTPDLEQFHPTSVLETGYDIIFFWVARMILMTGFLLGDIPFKTVYLHGLVRDESNRKLSKSLGNAIDPLDMIAKYGADAVRMALIVGTGPGSDSKIGDNKIKAYKHFANKIWNITRFVITNAPADTWELNLQAENHPYLAELEALQTEITDDMENFRFYLAAEKLYHYVWHTFADKIIEEAKKDPAIKALLPHILKTCLKLLHPFMPYITEELWSLIPGADRMLIIEPWPAVRS